MINTTIKYSAKLALLKKFNVAKNIEAIIKQSIEFKEYHIIYKGVLEAGIELNFFEAISKENLLRIHILLKSTFKDYKCYYINNQSFEGCIKEYLFNDGCSVKGVYKQGFKQENITVKPIIKQEVKKVITKKSNKKIGRPKGSKNKKTITIKTSSLLDNMLRASKNKDWARKLLKV